MANIAGQYNKVAKLLDQIEAKGWKAAATQWPVDMVILPTSVCNLNCVHCIFRRRNKNLMIPWKKLELFIRTCAAHGVKAVEYSGGEPTLYPQIAECVRLVHSLGMDQGLITNGLALSTALTASDMSCCTWIRVSLDALTEGIPVPHPNVPKGTRLTTSYIWSSRSSLGILEEVARWSEEQGVPCRVVPDAFLPLCCVERDECKRACAKLPGTINLIDRDEDRKTPNNCYMCWWKPALAWDGWLYACCYSAIKEWNLDLCEEFRTVPMEDVEAFYTKGLIHDLGFRCSSCLGWLENIVLGASRAAIEDPNFL